MPNLEILAIKIGNDLKYDTTVNEIERIAKPIFNFDCLEFPNDSITSVRAKLIYDWIMTLNEQEISEEDKLELLKEFVDELAPKDHSVRELLNKKIPKRNA